MKSPPWAAAIAAWTRGSRERLGNLLREHGFNMKYLRAVFGEGLAADLAGTGVKLVDTRKTTPLLRQFEKMAVRIGGGENHRFGLFDMIMIKDNHIAYAGGVEQAITSVRSYLDENNLRLKIEIEAGSLEQVQQIIALGGVDRIMLDNFTPEGAKQAVELIAGRYETEVSGGIVLDNVRAYAESGCDYISVGALTHSVKSLDLSLKAV